MKESKRMEVPFTLQKGLIQKGPSMLNAAMKSIGATQEVMSKATGIPRQTLAYILSGRMNATRAEATKSHDL